MGAILAALSYLKPLFGFASNWAFPTGKLVVYGGLLLGILACVLIIDRQGYNRGYAKALNAIAAQNDKAIKAAQAIRAKVEKCYAEGGQWDIETGRCARSQ